MHGKERSRQGPRRILRRHDRPYHADMAIGRESGALRHTFIADNPHRADNRLWSNGEGDDATDVTRNSIIGGSSGPNRRSVPGSLAVTMIANGPGVTGTSSVPTVYEQLLPTLHNAHQYRLFFGSYLNKRGRVLDCRGMARHYCCAIQAGFGFGKTGLWKARDRHGIGHSLSRSKPYGARLAVEEAFSTMRFATLTRQPDDPLLRIIGQHAADPGPTRSIWASASFATRPGTLP